MKARIILYLTLQGVKKITWTKFELNKKALANSVTKLLLSLHVKFEICSIDTNCLSFVCNIQLPAKCDLWFLHSMLKASGNECSFMFRKFQVKIVLVVTKLFKYLHHNKNRPNRGLKKKKSVNITRKQKWLYKKYWTRS